jgi:hypothetical protein
MVNAPWVSFLKCHQARQLYRIGSLHPPGHSVTAATPRNTIKGTHCVPGISCSQTVMWILYCVRKVPMLSDEIPFHFLIIFWYCMLHSNCHPIHKQHFRNVWHYSTPVIRVILYTKHISSFWYNFWQWYKIYKNWVYYTINWFSYRGLWK